MSSLTEFAELKAKQKVMWGLGEYDGVARTLHPAQDHVIRVARPVAGEHVLDVATGTGNTAIKARLMGAKVTGLDFASELLAVARKKAASEGLDDIRFDEADAGKMPYADNEFDVVLSTCGHMFAPDQEQVAREMVRVTRPGGRIVFMAWTPESGVGRLFKVIAQHVPPPAGVPSPFRWGTTEGVKALLPNVRDVRFEEGDSVDTQASPEAITSLYATKYGPTVRALASVDGAKRDALYADLLAFFRTYQTPADGKARWGREYVLTSARKS